jgi:hypothetical protein
MNSVVRSAGVLSAVVLWSALGIGNADAATCEDLAKLQLPNISMTLAENVSAGSFKPPAGTRGGPGMATAFAALPAFCRVAGTIKPTPDSDIRFEVWMPAANWNGKFVGVGNGVWAGAISYPEMIAPLSKGYATAATDDGHQGNPLDASFAAGDPKAHRLCVSRPSRDDRGSEGDDRSLLREERDPFAVRELLDRRASGTHGGAPVSSRLRRDLVDGACESHGSTYGQLVVDRLRGTERQGERHPARKVRARAQGGGSGV